MAPYRHLKEAEPDDDGEIADDGNEDAEGP